MTRKTLILCLMLTGVVSNSTENDEKMINEKILTRKKRYLTFPTGSSISIATCMNTGVYGNPQTTILSWAMNYGFAYNLPTNSSEFLQPPADVSTFPFYNSRDRRDTTIGRRSFETQPMIHRRYRRDMYRNIEAVINKMGYNGRDCVLRALCESSTMFENKKRRTMIQEMIKTVFTMPKSKVLPFEHPELLIYDKAFRDGRQADDCQLVHTKCNFSLIKLILGKYSTDPYGFM